MKRQTIISERSEKITNKGKDLNASINKMFKKYDETFKILAEEGEGQNDTGR